MLGMRRKVILKIKIVNVAIYNYEYVRDIIDQFIYNIPKFKQFFMLSKLA